jgi:hypothetical protein
MSSNIVLTQKKKKNNPRLALTNQDLPIQIQAQMMMTSKIHPSYKCRENLRNKISPPKKCHRQDGVWRNMTMEFEQ